MFIVAIHVVAPVDFVDFAGGGAGGGGFEITRERKHSNIAGVLIKTDDHNGVGELSAIVNAIAFFAFHIVAASAKGEDVGAAIVVGFETFVGGFGEGDEIEDVALATGDLSNNIITPENEPGDGTD